MSTADLLIGAAKRAALARGDAVQVQDTDWRWWPAKSPFVLENPYKVWLQRRWCHHCALLLEHARG
jgi:hypothetical protein